MLEKTCSDFATLIVFLQSDLAFKKAEWLMSVGDGNGLSEWGMNLSNPVRITFIAQSEMTSGSLELKQVDDHGKEEKYKQNSSHLALR